MGLSLVRAVRGSLVIVALAVLTACNASQGEQTEPAIFTFRLSPASQPANQALALCAAQTLDEGSTYRIETLFPSQMQPEALDLVIHLGPERADFPFTLQIGAERFFLITHTSNPVRAFSEAELAGVFSGRIANWSELGGENAAIQVWVATQSDESRGYLQEFVLNGLPISSNARLASSPQRMLDAVSEDPSAIGLVPGAWLDSSVHSTALEQSLPLLLSSPQDFAGALQNLAACLQSGAGQELLKELYAE